MSVETKGLPLLTCNTAIDILKTARPSHEWQGALLSRLWTHASEQKASEAPLQEMRLRLMLMFYWESKPNICDATKECLKIPSLSVLGQHISKKRPGFQAQSASC